MTITAKHARAIRDGILGAREAIQLVDIGVAPQFAVRMTLQREPAGVGTTFMLYTRARLRTFEHYALAAARKLETELDALIRVIDPDGEF